MSIAQPPPTQPTPPPSTAPRSTGWMSSAPAWLQAIGAIGGLALTGAIAFNLLGGGTPQPSIGPSASPAESMGGEDLAHSVVLVQMMVDGEMIGWGSGTVISDDGLILTNAHVATPTEVVLDELLIAVTDRSDAAPEPRYAAEVVAADRVLDLAVLRITGTIAGGPYDGALVPLEIGDSSDVALGDAIVILGYPAIGGQTITFTDGRVSGFTSDDVLGARAWIKTDATLTGGNSGGLAANAAGQLIGVPTIVGAGEEIGAVVDCRPVADTNRDGVINDSDECVPIGGFLNGVRPINLALELIAAVQNGVAYEPIGGLPDPVDNPNTAPDDFDVEGVDFGRPIFDSVQPDVQPADDVVWLASGITQLCGWWDFSGMENGVSWDAIWTLDGEIQEDISYLGEVWTGGASGEWWVCFTSEGPVDEGFWDLSLNVQGELIAASFVAVGDSLAPVDLTITNGGGATVCYVQVSPATSLNWGRDWLGAENVLAAGDSVTIEIPPATYDLRGLDCDVEELWVDQQEILTDTELTY